MTTDRQHLAGQQREVLERIRSAHPPDHLQHAADTLAAKRTREALLAAPMLAQALGDQWTPLFTQFAAVIGYPRRGGPASDAAAFGAWLRPSGRFPPTALREHARLSLRAGQPVRFFFRGGLLLGFRWRGRLFLWP